MNAPSPERTISTALVCTDGSDDALAAIELGLARLGPHDRIVLVTVLEPLDESLVTGVSGFGAGSLSPEQYHELDRQRRADAEQLLEDTAQHSGLLDAERRSLEGAPGPAICDAALDLDADVIVMGSRGRGGLRRAVLGSVSDHVVRHARCPVLITNVHHDEP